MYGRVTSNIPRLSLNFAVLLRSIQRLRNQSRLDHFSLQWTSGRRPTIENNLTMLDAPVSFDAMWGYCGALYDCMVFLHV